MLSIASNHYKMADVAEPMDVDSHSEIRGQDLDANLSNLPESEDNSTTDLSFILDPRYQNKDGTFTTGIDIFSKEEQDKMEERAKRFGIDSNTKHSLEQEEDLYKSMSIPSDVEGRKNIRLNVLHMRGTEEMSTMDVFEYFKNYPPASVEWINDECCNVSWRDKITATRALLGLSKKISVHEAVPSGTETPHEIENEKMTDESTEKIENAPKSDEQLAGIWRKGVHCPKSEQILLRFATNADKKLPNSGRSSEYYRKYGRPDTFRRQEKPIKRLLSEPMENGGDRKRAKNPWGSLSENWGVHDAVEDDFIRKREEPPERGSVKERLGFKARVEVEVESSESSESEEEWNRRSKTLRMRMHADDEEEKVQKRKLKQLTQRVHDQVSNTDLRSKLARSKPPVYRDAIQVIVTNEPERYRSGRVKDEAQEDGGADESADEKEEGELDEDEKSHEDEAADEEEAAEELEEEEEEQVEEENDDESDDDDESDSDVSEKEVQGPQGSVIKVVSRAKPRVASTVWARLKHEEKNSDVVRSDQKSSIKGDVRSRLGYHNRGRSPLRIEVRNDQYAVNSNDSE